MDAETRCRYVASLYCKLGTLTAVSKVVGVTSERIRQIMNEGHRKGWCNYRPFMKQSACNAIALLPEAIKTARSRTHLLRLCRLDHGTGTKLLASLDLLTDEASRTFKENAREFYIGRLLKEAERLGVSDSLNTTVLQSDRAAKSAYVSAIRHFGSIHAIRERAVIASTARRIA